MSAASLAFVAVACVPGCGRVGYGQTDRADAGTGASADASAPPAWLACLEGEGPIVLYTFDGLDGPGVIPDRAPLEPDVPLALEPRDPPGAAVMNGELVLSGGLLMASESDSTALSLALLAADELTVEAWARPDTADFGGIRGPRRIVTLSQDECRRAFLLGQQEVDLQVRLQTSGTPVDPCPVLFASGPAFDVSLGPHHLALTYTPATGLQTAFADGIAVGEAMHPLGSTFDSWATDLERLRVGAENDSVVDPDYERRFAGTIQRIAIYRRALSADELGCLAAMPP